MTGGWGPVRQVNDGVISILCGYLGAAALPTSRAGDVGVSVVPEMPKDQESAIEDNSLKDQRDPQQAAR